MKIGLIDVDSHNYPNLALDILHWMPLPAPPDRRPPERDCEIKACAETCDEYGFCDNTLASPPEGQENL